MKKSILLLAAAVIAIAPTMSAKSAMDGILSCKWMNTNVASLESDARQAVGVNGKMYLQNHTTQKVEVWDATGKVAEYATANTTNINRDDAGNVIVRISPVFPSGATAHTIRVFNPADMTVYQDINITNHPSGRADFFGHIAGNVMSQNGGIMANGAQWNGNLGVTTIMGADAATVQYPFNTLAHANLAVSGTFTTTHLASVYSFLPNEVALLSPHYQTTDIGSGYGNSIYRLAKNDEGNYVPSGFYTTPNHNGCTGFDVFECDGNKYIVYSTGSNLGDGFSVAKVIIKDTPANETTDADARIASKYAEMKEDNSGTLYGHNAFYGNHLNAEPAGAHKVNIYQYCPKGYIAMYELDLTQFAPTAVEEIDTEATVVGIYNLQGMRLNEMSQGVNILHMSDGSARKVLK